MPPSQKDDAIEEEKEMYERGPNADEIAKFPNRPHNHSLTLPFHDLPKSLFNPLSENKNKPLGPPRAKKGRDGPKPHEVRQSIIEKFISRWRKEVGDDIYPALRLIIPEKDRDRAMYGLKEKNLGKILVKILRIDKNSEDGYNLLNWKLPGQKNASKNAGDFAGRCFEVISKRPMRTKVGDMRVGEVNVLLDRLSGTQKEDEQIPIFETFYKRMNADELMWLIRIILRQMKVGATEKTFLNLWHPDAEALFNISSSLRRCCWELTDPSERLSDNNEDVSVSLMQCFQPQLAQYQMHNFKKMVELLNHTTGEIPKKGSQNSQKEDSQKEDKEFWIEEKLDGERMQLHMEEDSNVLGGKRFAFWSRKAKDYTYLYGNGFYDDDSALTRHIRDAFDARVRNVILDGEMITWDPETDKMVGFGTLKTAAIAEGKNPYRTGPRPLFRVFDILFLNDTPLTMYELKDRRDALDQSVKDVPRRIEKHTYVKAHKPEDIEPLLRKVVAEASEGLVLKNPSAPYRLNDRNNDWMKVKPEYMTEFGESLDCVVIGGYYGSGHRGGNLSSFLCGLRLDKDRIRATKSNPEKCLSFFKVGGGFRAEDYASIRHHTDGKWIDWDPKNPPTDYIELGGGSIKQFERPDVWIKPSDSVVVSAKAASVGLTEQFAVGLTLRFPRFKGLRLDRSWDTALSLREFIDLKNKAEAESKEKKFEVDTRRRAPKRFKKDMTIAGSDGKDGVEYAGPSSTLFEGLNFHIMSERTIDPKKSKAELEQMVKAHGGNFFQSPTTVADMICIADRRLVKVAALVKANNKKILNSSWILDCISQANIDTGKPRHLLRDEPRYMFHMPGSMKQEAEGNVDEYGDSYARDVTVQDLRQIIQDMPKPEESLRGSEVFAKVDEELGEVPGHTFRRAKVYMDYMAAGSLVDATPGQLRMKLASNLLRFGGGELMTDMDDESITHMVVHVDNERDDAKAFRQLTVTRTRLPRILTVEWIEDSWLEKTLLDEERFAPL